MAIAQKSAAKKVAAPAAKKTAAPVAKAAAKKATAPMPAAKKAALLGALPAPAATKEASAHFDRQAADDSALVAIMKGMREACEQKKIQKIVNAIRAQGFAVSMGRAEKLIPLALAKAAGKPSGNSKGR